MKGSVPSTIPVMFDGTTQFTPMIRPRPRSPCRSRLSGWQGLEAFADAFQLSYVAEKEIDTRTDRQHHPGRCAKSAFRRVTDPADPVWRSSAGQARPSLCVNDQEKPIGVDAGYAIQLVFVSADKGGLNNMVNYSNAQVE